MRSFVSMQGCSCLLEASWSLHIYKGLWKEVGAMHVGLKRWNDVLELRTTRQRCLGYVHLCKISLALQYGNQYWFSPALCQTLKTSGISGHNLRGCFFSTACTSTSQRRTSYDSLSFATRSASHSSYHIHPIHTRSWPLIGRKHNGSGGFILVSAELPRNLTAGLSSRAGCSPWLLIVLAFATMPPPSFLHYSIFPSQ